MTNDEYDFGPDGIAPCPFCGSSTLGFWGAEPKYVACENCLQDEVTIDAWNEPARRELALRWALEVQEAWLRSLGGGMNCHADDELYATYVKAMKDAGMEVEDE